MTIQSMADLEFGMEFGPWTPNTALASASAAANAVGWTNAARFSNHEGARHPGALVPGILGMGFLCALIHREMPAARIENVDTVFRAPLVADQPCTVTAVITDIDVAKHRAELDLHIKNAKGETRIFGTATISMPT